MPGRATERRTKKKARKGSPSTQAGEYVREEIRHVRKGKHGARSTKQAIAIGLSKARRSGVKLPAPKKGKTSKRTRRQAQRDLAKGQTRRRRKASPKRSRAAKKALEREGTSAASTAALSRQAKAAAARRRKRAAR